MHVDFLTIDNDDPIIITTNESLSEIDRFSELYLLLLQLLIIIIDLYRMFTVMLQLDRKHWSLEHYE